MTGIMEVNLNWVTLLNFSGHSVSDHKGSIISVQRKLSAMLTNIEPIEKIMNGERRKINYLN